MMFVLVSSGRRRRVAGANRKQLGAVGPALASSPARRPEEGCESLVGVKKRKKRTKIPELNVFVFIF